MDHAGQKQATDRDSVPQRVDLLVVGAGFGGMYMLHRAREFGLVVCGIEAGGDVGGTWYWNRYPGIRCDVMSIDYSYSFSNDIQQEWTWSERFAAGAEILSYANYVADKLDIRRDFHFHTRVASAVFVEKVSRWLVTTTDGRLFDTTYCVMATGPLSIPKAVDIPGVEAFSGKVYQSGKWPHEDVDFTGKRLAVVGTGSSGIQIVPVVAEQAKELWVFQRTPSFTLPMRNKRLDADFVAQVKRHYPSLRAAARTTFGGGVRPVTARPFFSVPEEERRDLLEDAWERGGLNFLGAFSDLLTNEEANGLVADFVRSKIDQVVDDPDIAERLKPRGYPIFARRPCLDTHYYETYNRSNVTLIDCLAEPIVRFVDGGLQTTKQTVELDIVILATGYDGLTGAMLAMDVRGRSGRALGEKWSAGARSYLGLAAEGFPNLFMMGAPNGPSVVANFFALHEQNAEWIIECLKYMRDRDLSLVEATADAETDWVNIVAGLAKKSLMPRANTWYVGTNIPGKPRVFSIYTGGLNNYIAACDQVIAENFGGLRFEASGSDVRDFTAGSLGFPHSATLSQTEP